MAYAFNELMSILFFELIEPFLFVSKEDTWILRVQLESFPYVRPAH